MPSSVFTGSQSGDTFLCGLPLFRVNAVLVTGLANWIKGAIEKVYGAALAEAGIPAKVAVAADPAVGTVARIALADAAQRGMAEQALARYTVRIAFD